MSEEKLFEVRPRMEAGGRVVVEVVKTDDGATLALMQHAQDLSAYQGAHALKDGLEEAFLQVFHLGYAQALADAMPKPEPPKPVTIPAPPPVVIVQDEPTAPAPPVAPAEEPKWETVPATEPEGAPKP